MSAAIKNRCASGAAHSKDTTKLGAKEKPVDSCKTGTKITTAMGDNLSIVVVTVVEVGADDPSVEVIFEGKSEKTCEP